MRSSELRKKLGNDTVDIKRMVDEFVQIQNSVMLADEFSAALKQELDENNATSYGTALGEAVATMHAHLVQAHTAGIMASDILRDALTAFRKARVVRTESGFVVD